jgi:hypothetical protein
VRSFDSGLSAAFAVRDTSISGKTVLSPREGNDQRPGFVLPVCEIDARTHRVIAVDLHPMTWSQNARASTGFPVVANPATSAAVLDRIAELSEPYGTKIVLNGEIGRVTA